MTYTNNQLEVFVKEDLYQRGRNGDNQAYAVLLEHIRVEKQLAHQNERQKEQDKLQKPKELTALEHQSAAFDLAPKCHKCKKPVPAWIGHKEEGGICLNCQ